MSQKIRQDEILRILQEQEYATVRDLTAILHYSSATINRDLNFLQNLGIVKRNYGGVELVGKQKLPPLPIRIDFMKKEKRHIGRTAAELIEDGDVIFIDGSTTTQYMAPYLVDKKELCVITNNMQLALILGEYKMEVVCLGGHIVERPHMLAGDETVENALRYHADKAFFPTGAFSIDGRIATGAIYHLIHKIMMRNSKKTYFLADRSKVRDSFSQELCDFAALNGVVSDFEFPQETQRKFPNTEFICV